VARKQTDTVQLKLRFPEKLRRRIETAAERMERSMNAEIVDRLERSFEREDSAQLVKLTAHAVAANMSNEWIEHLHQLATQLDGVLKKVTESRGAAQVATQRAEIALAEIRAVLSRADTVEDGERAGRTATQQAEIALAQIRAAISRAGEPESRDRKGEKS
jgi:hypothetical protein